MENKESENPLKLVTSFYLENDKLKLSYKVTNSSEKPVYLFNKLWTYDNQGNQLPAPQSVYASLNKDNTLHLTQRIPPLPTSKEVELRIIPFVTKVEANSEFSEDIEIGVPVEEYNPYFPKTENSKTELRTAESVVFTLQFIQASDKLKVNETPIQDALSVWHPDIFGNVETIASNPSPLEVKVNKRLDGFEAF